MGSQRVWVEVEPSQMEVDGIAGPLSVAVPAGQPLDLLSSSPTSAAADRRDEKILRQRAGYWTSRLTPTFSSPRARRVRASGRWPRSNSPAT